MVTVETVPTQPFSGQKPGTSGLRKKVVEVQQAHYLENFVQCIFDALPTNELTGATLVVSGDGRYHNRTAIRTICRMAVANGVTRVVLGQHGLMSTPCVSAVIRALKCYGGIILTASHNPGGPDQDFGIKYNCANGGPAPEQLTDVMFAKTKTISQYKIAKEEPEFDIATIGDYAFGALTISVIDATAEYSKLMQSIFSFPLLREFLARPDFSFVYDCMHGVAGPFAKRIFLQDLGAKPQSLMNANPKEDFGGGHPDPNLTYAEELVARLGLGPHAAAVTTSSVPDFGAASDGDADRNMILGSRFFVTPSDSVAIIAANASSIPYFVQHGLSGVARSMPTSAAVDRVAKQKNLQCFEVPTGWKFFGNLMDAGKISICGEESFGTGSDHIREKDGMWAILAWLSILADKNKGNTGALVTVQQVVEAHWAQYGRNYYSRYDYEQVETDRADRVIATLLELVKTSTAASAAGAPVVWGSYTVQTADEFTYHDPVDGSVSAHQGIRFLFTDGSRIVFRLSGTGSVGATIRVYIERYEATQLSLATADALKELIEIALRISKMEELTGRSQPTVIT